MADSLERSSERQWEYRSKYPDEDSSREGKKSRVLAHGDPSSATANVFSPIRGQGSFHSSQQSSWTNGPISASKSTRTVDRNGSQCHQIVIDDPWQEVFRESFSMTLTAEAASFCYSNLALMDSFRRDLDVTVNISLGKVEKKIEITGNPKSLSEFSRRISSEMNTVQAGPLAEVTTTAEPTSWEIGSTSPFDRASVRTANPAQPIRATSRSIAASFGSSLTPDVADKQQHSHSHNAAALRPDNPFPGNKDSTLTDDVSPGSPARISHRRRSSSFSLGSSSGHVDPGSKAGAQSVTAETKVHLTLGLEEGRCPPFQINSLTTRYVLNVCAEELSKIEKKHGVVLKILKKDDKAGTSLIAAKSTSQGRSHLDRGYECIRDVCIRASHIQFAEETVSFSLSKLEFVRKVVAKKLKPSETKALVEINDKSNEVSIYGSQQAVDETSAKLQEYLKKQSSMPSTAYGRAGTHSESAKPRISVKMGDITTEKVDVIVCGSNRHLFFISGTARAIKAAGGSIIEEECKRHIKRQHRSLATGDTVMTGAGQLPSRYVCHAVLDGVNTVQLLSQTCLECLRSSASVQAKSIAIPALGCGGLGLPPADCIRALLDSTDRFIETMGKRVNLKEIVFIDKSKALVDEFRRQLKARESGLSPVSSSSSLSPAESTPRSLFHEVSSKSRLRQGSSNSRDSIGNVTQTVSMSGTAAGVKTPAACQVVSGAKNIGGDNCAVCMSSITDEKTLPCGHGFCRNCIDQWFRLKPSCPTCSRTFGKLTGAQPDSGTMKIKSASYTLPGYEGYGTIEISYYIPSGIQASQHPNPGKQFVGASRVAYLPDNKEGNRVLKLLQRAFDAKLIFTIGQSRTTGADNQVTWNDIHHKTSRFGGPLRYGYPDPTYLDRVRDELKAKGIE